MTMATFDGITRKHIGGGQSLHTESVKLFKLDIEVELLVEVVEEVEERRRRNMDIDLALEECKEDLANMTKSVAGF